MQAVQDREGEVLSVLSIQTEKAMSEAMTCLAHLRQQLFEQNVGSEIIAKDWSVQTTSK